MDPAESNNYILDLVYNCEIKSTNQGTEVEIQKIKIETAYEIQSGV